MSAGELSWLASCLPETATVEMSSAANSKNIGICFIRVIPFNLGQMPVYQA